MTQSEGRRVPSALVAGSVVLAILLPMHVIGANRVLQSDSFMLLSIGRHILDEGLPTVDSLSVEAAGVPWTPQQWLASVVYYAVHRLAGYPGLAILGGLSASAAYAAMTAATVRRGATTWIAMVVAATFALVGASFLFVRAELLAMPLGAGVLALVTAQERDRRLPAVAFVLLAIWANVHGSVLLGVSWVLLRAIAPWLGLLAPRERSGAWHWGVACFGVVLTPWGAGVVTYYASIGGNDVIRSRIEEWFPLFGAPVTYEAIVAATVAVVVVLVVSLVTRRVEVWRMDTILLALASVATVLAVRNVLWLALTATLALPRLLSGLHRHAHEEGGAGNVAGVLAATSGALLVLSATLTTLWSVRWPDENYTVLASREVQTATLHAWSEAGPGATVIADPTLAAALPWLDQRLVGAIAFDARLEIFPESRLEAWLDFDRSPGAASEGVLLNYDIVAWRDPAVADYLVASDEWRVTFRSKREVVAVRVAGD